MRSPYPPLLGNIRFSCGSTCHYIFTPSSSLRAMSVTRSGVKLINKLMVTVFNNNRLIGVVVMHGGSSRSRSHEAVSRPSYTSGPHFDSEIGQFFFIFSFFFLPSFSGLHSSAHCLILLYSFPPVFWPFSYIATTYVEERYICPLNNDLLAPSPGLPLPTGPFSSSSLLLPLFFIFRIPY